MQAGPRHGNRRPAPRGFTILEVVMASVLGLLVASGCFAIFTALNKTDQTLGRRYHEIVELERLHNIMQRSFQSLVVSGEPKPIKAPNSDGSVSDLNASSSKFSKPNDGTASDSSSQGGSNRSTGSRLGDDRIPIPGSRQSRLRNGGSDGASRSASADPDATKDLKPDAKPDSKSLVKPPPPPRMLLRPDVNVADVPMNHRLARMQLGAATQRFELVLNNYPTASGSNASKAADEELRKSNPDLGAGERAVRGEFFLRPTQGLAAGQPLSWTIWWQSLRAPDGVVSADSRLADLVPAAQPVPIATDLAYCRWQIFAGRTRRVDFDATWENELPAYIEMEVETVGGLWSSWMFEVGWSRGQESAPPDDADPTDPTAGGTPKDGTGKSTSRPLSKPGTPAAGASGLKGSGVSSLGGPS